MEPLNASRLKLSRYMNSASGKSTGLFSIQTLVFEVPKLDSVALPFQCNKTFGHLTLAIRAGFRPVQPHAQALPSRRHFNGIPLARRLHAAFGCRGFESLIDPVHRSVAEQITAGQGQLGLVPDQIG